MRFPDRQARGKPDLQERLSCSHRNRSRGRRACVCVDISSSSWENPRCFVLRVRCMSACVDSRLGSREGQRYTRNREGKRVFETRERHSTAAFLSPFTAGRNSSHDVFSSVWGHRNGARVKVGCGHGVMGSAGLSREIKVK